MIELVQGKLKNKLNSLIAKLIDIEQQLKDESGSHNSDNLMIIKDLLEIRDQTTSEIQNLEDVLNALDENISNKNAYNVVIDGRQREFRIVPQELADPYLGLISSESPLAQALLSKVPGINKVQYNTPFGMKEAEILGEPAILSA
jgi:transcription elongation GreA/GreB family factor